MFNTRTISLEEMPVGFTGQVEHPVICGPCYNALHKERGAWSCPKSYAAIATSAYWFRVIDWLGLGTTTCRCCGSQDYNERHSVSLELKPKRVM
jgi:hypothetical protein